MVPQNSIIQKKSIQRFSVYLVVSVFEKKRRFELFVRESFEGTEYLALNLQTFIAGFDTRFVKFYIYRENVRTKHDDAY